MDKRKRAVRLFKFRQRTSLALIVVFCLISLAESPMKPDIPDFHWSFMAFFFAMIVAFVYLLNEKVGPDYGDDE